MSLTAIVFLAIFFIGSAAALLIDPSFGIFTYIIAYFLNPTRRWWGGQLPDVRFAYSIAMLTVVGFFIRSGKYSRNKIFDAPQTKWLMLFFVLMILTFPVAVDKAFHKEYIALFLKYLFFYFIILKVIDTPQKFGRMMGAFLAGQFYIGWVARFVGRTSDGRLEGIGVMDATDANVLAAVLVVSVPILLNYLMIGKKWQKVCCLIIFVFVLNALILINSRGAFVAILTAVVYYLFLSFRLPSFPKFNKARLIQGIVVGAAIFLLLADPIFWERMETLTDTSGEVETGRDRTHYWMKTFDVLRDHPFGVGVGGYEYLSPGFLPEGALSPDTHTRAVHSTYFQVLGEYGYHGFALYITFLISNFSYMRKLKKSLRKMKLYEPYTMAIALEAGLIAFLTAAIFIDRLYAEVLYWTSAFIAAYGNIYFREIKEIEEIQGNNKELPASG